MKWTNTDQLADLDFADDLALLVNNSMQLHQITDSLKSNTEKVSLCINTRKIKIKII